MLTLPGGIVLYPHRAGHVKHRWGVESNIQQRIKSQLQGFSV